VKYRSFSLFFPFSPSLFKVPLYSRVEWLARDGLIVFVSVEMKIREFIANSDMKFSERRPGGKHGVVF